MMVYFNHLTWLAVSSQGFDLIVSQKHQVRYEEYSTLSFYMYV